MFIIFLHKVLTYLLSKTIFFLTFSKDKYIHILPKKIISIVITLRPKVLIKSGQEIEN